MTSLRPSVLLVEDESSIAVPFASALRREGFDPVIAATAAEARVAWRVSRPSVVLLDLTLPDGDGRQLCQELHAELGDVPVIMVTARGTETDRIVGLELGADDYVVKPFSAAEVAARIRAVLRRAAVPADVAGERIEAGGLVVDLAARTVELDGAPVGLARKEFDLLARLASDAGRTVTREALMRDVWDENWFGSTKTLDVHVAAVRRHLHDDAASPRFIHTVRGVGFRFQAADGPGR